jgi:hypothetical protein
LCGLCGDGAGPACADQAVCAKVKNAERACAKASVQRKCPRLCDVCEDTADAEPAPCEDKPACAKLKSTKQCWKSSVQNKCKRLCGVCDAPSPAPATTVAPDAGPTPTVEAIAAAETTTTPAPTTTGPRGVCEDKPACRKLQSARQCDRDNVRRLCKRLCDLCDDGSRLLTDLASSAEYVFV